MAASAFANTAYAAPRINPMPPASFSLWNLNAPSRGPMMFQWGGVYYASSMPYHAKRRALLNMKRAEEVAQRDFAAARDVLLKEARSGQGPFARPVQRPAETVRLAVRLNNAGSVDVTRDPIDVLARAGKIDPLAYTALLESLAAPDVVRMLCATETAFDLPEALKRAADWSGAARAREAAGLVEMVRAGSSSVTTHHINGLMATYLTSGFAEASRVHGQVYDSLGIYALNPNARTYLLTMQSLCLTGKPEEAQSIFDFLKHRCPHVVTTEHYDTMLWGWRLAKMFDRVDETWNELVSRQHPRPSVQSAELYLRSILALAATPMAQPHTEVASLNEVERKRIPLVIQQMKTLGIPQSQLSPPIVFEVMDAMRKYSTSKQRFYNWGRSVKQFGFLDWRRRHNAADTLTEINSPVLHAHQPPVTNDPTVAVGEMATTVGYAQQPAPWEVAPLPELLNDISIAESTGRTNRKFTQQVDPIHHRPNSWMSDVPETRYDKLYGLGNPNLTKLGVRRQLLGERPDKEELSRHDKRIVSRTLGSAKRVRASVDRAKTHRAAE